MTLSEAALDLHARAFVADLHCDLLLTSRLTGWRWERRHRDNPLEGAPLFGHVDLPRMVEGGLSAVCLGLVTNPLWTRGGHGEVQAYLDRMAHEVATHPDLLAAPRTAAEARAAHATGRVSLFAGMEGVHCLREDPSPLEGWRAQGLLYVGLVHFSANRAGHPMVGWGADRSAGLTDFGRALADELGHLGLLVDVAHLGTGGLLEVCARSRLPVLSTHSAMNAVHRSRRGIEDAEALAIARTGGLVGVIFASSYLGSGEIACLLDHLDHLKAVVGVEHCALGSDWEGWVRYVRGLGSVASLPAVTDGLLRRGWHEEEILAVLGENFLRVLDQRV
ncbi:MAG: membrane dipeptidase [Pseudomonadota bacterium]